MSVSGAELISISLFETQILLNDDEGVFDVDSVYGRSIVIPLIVLVGLVGVVDGGVTVVGVVLVADDGVTVVLGAVV